MTNQKTTIPENIFDAIRDGKADVDYDNPPKLSDEEKTAIVKKTILKKAIIDRAGQYVKTPIADRPAKKYLLREIQEIVDQVDDAFVLMVNDAKGIPTCVTFNPNTPEPVDPTIHETDSQ